MNQYVHSAEKIVSKTLHRYLCETVIVWQGAFVHGHCLAHLKAKCWFSLYIQRVVDTDISSPAKYATAVFLLEKVWNWKPRTVAP